MHILEDGKTYLVSVKDLTQLVNPMLEDVWECGVITSDDVARVRNIKLGAMHLGVITPEYVAEVTDVDLGSMHLDDENFGKTDGYFFLDWREYHIARIVWLMNNGWGKEESILVDCFKDRDEEKVIIVDGNHRVSAAFLNGMDFIEVELTGTASSLASFASKVSCKTVKARESSFTNTRGVLR